MTKTPWVSTLVLMALVIGSALTISKIELNNVPQVYLPKTAPAVLIDEELRTQFPSDQGMAFLFDGPEIFSDNFLVALEGAANLLGKSNKVQRIFAVTNQDHIETNEDGFHIEPLIDLDQLADWDMDYRRTRASSDLLARGMVVGKQGGAFALVVVPRAIDDSLERIELQDWIYRTLDDFKLRESVTAEAGLITTDVAQTRETINQLSVFMPVTVGAGLLLLWTLFRRPIALVVGILVITASVSPPIALYSIFGLPFNLISSILPPLLCALALAALVHLLTGTKHASNIGLQGHERVAFALKHSKRPALFSALTTMAGFGSLGVSDIRPISHLGFATLFGVGLIYVVVFYLIPPILHRFDHAPWPKTGARFNFVQVTLRSAYQFSCRRPVSTLFVSVGMLLVLAPVTSRIVVETNLLEFFPADHKIRKDTLRFEQKFSGTGSLEILFEAPQFEGLVSLPALDWITEIQQWAEKQPEVDTARSWQGGIRAASATYTTAHSNAGSLTR